jgi:DGQHR domain-containing protein
MATPIATTKQYIDFKCLEATQPIGTLYVGVMDHDDVEFISYADVRRLELGIDNREVEDYIGIQRQLVDSREKDIGRYVNLIDATFPNSVILSVSSEHATYNPNTGIMTLLRKDDIAKVLDGQHRIAGLHHFTSPASKFQLVVSIFIDMALEDQAIVFATINKEQKNVSNSLVADLFAFAESRSPQKTAHNIARALNKKEGSPFHKKIKILGTAVNKDLETITQDTFVKSIIQYMSKDPQEDRNFYKVNRGSKKKLPLLPSDKIGKYVLRNMFISDEKDVNIAQLIWNYFSAVQMRWPSAWNPLQPNIILNRSTGFIALMRFFKDVYIYLGQPDTVIEKKDFQDIFNSIDISANDFTKDVYVPGSSGQGKLYQDLLTKSGLPKG